jgi:hypothetical protein
MDEEKYSRLPKPEPQKAEPPPVPPGPDSAEPPEPPPGPDATEG